MNEELYPIPGFPDYFITKSGKVMGRKKSNLNLNQELRENKPYMRKGYLAVKLRRGKERKAIFIHRLVAMTFIPNPNNLPCVNHKDQNCLNNNYDNLEWCTVKYNNTYGSLQGRKIKRTSCVAYQGETIIGNFPSVTQAADFIVANYDIPHADGILSLLECYDSNNILFRIVRDGIDTFEWNAKRNKPYVEFENKNQRGTTAQKCVLMKGTDMIKSFDSKQRLCSWVRTNLKIPISHIIRYGYWEDYHIEKIQ